MFRFTLPLIFVSILCAPLGQCQSDTSRWNNSSSSLLAAGAPAGTSSSGIISTRVAPPAASRPMLFSHFAVGANVGVLGIGVESATTLSRHFNLRAGSHFLTLNEALSDSGVNYNADLHFRTAEASVDWFPWARSSERLLPRARWCVR